MGRTSGTSTEEKQSPASADESRPVGKSRPGCFPIFLEYQWQLSGTSVAAFWKEPGPSAKVQVISAVHQLITFVIERLWNDTGLFAFMDVLGSVEV